MLKFQKNVYDTLQSVATAMGTNPDPQWMLIYNTQENAYSAIDYDVPQDVIDYSLKNNLFNICFIDPIQLIEVLEHPEPHKFCQAIHEFVTLHRPDPDQIPLRTFLPFDPFHKKPPQDEVDKTDDVDLIVKAESEENKTSSAVPPPFGSQNTGDK